MWTVARPVQCNGVPWIAPWSVTRGVTVSTKTQWRSGVAAKRISVIHECRTVTKSGHERMF